MMPMIICLQTYKEKHNAYNSEGPYNHSVNAILIIIFGNQKLLRDDIWYNN